MKTVLKMLASTLIALVACAGLFVGGSLFQISQNMTISATAQALLGTGANDKADDSPKEPEVPDTLPDDFYVLLLGVDSDDNRRDGDEAQYFDGAFRSDTIIVAHVTMSTKKVTLCSLERDIKTKIAGYEDDGYYKLNAAYLLGDVYLMKDEAEEIVEVPIPYYAVIDMGGMTELVDILGGIDVDVEDAFWDEQLQDGLEQGGWQHLDGAQAVMYCRSRYAWADGDFARGRHQRQVIQAIASKLMQSDLFTLYNVANEVSMRVATNFTVPQIFEVAGKLRGMNPTTDMYSMMTPTYGEMGEDGISYQILNESAWEVMRRQFIANTDPAEAAATLDALGAGSLIDYDPTVNGTQPPPGEGSGDAGGGLSDLEAAEQAIASGVATDVTNS